MQSYPPIDMNDLLAAFDWVSSGQRFENTAYLSRVDGRIYWDSDASEDELPDDIEDGGIYIAVPHSSELGLGSRLAIRFAQEHLPDDVCDHVFEAFRHRGAFQRFKQLVDRCGKLQLWYDYCDQAQRDAIRDWCIDNDLLPPAKEEDHRDRA
jgi:hypothetical protein